MSILSIKYKPTMGIGGLWGLSSYLQASDGDIQPAGVLPGADPWLSPAYSPAGLGAGLAAVGHLPAVPTPLDVW